MDGQEIDLATLKTRSLTGVVTLISRSFILQIVATVGFLALTTFLGRPEIGLFIAVNDLVGILGYFSDIGLAASLIQKKTTVTIQDLRTTFTFQQIIVLALIGLAILFARPIFEFYKISGGGTSLFYALLLGFFLASLKTIPSVILERQLKFNILASVEVLENLVFYALAVFLAWQGYGVVAYVWAVVGRGVLGTALIYYLASWPIGFGFSLDTLKSLLKFGLPYQVNSLLAVVKDRFLNIFLWKTIGADGIGIIGWAQTWSQKPLRFIMDNVTKVTFPAYARLQDHPEQLKKAIEKTLFFITILTFPVLAGLSLVASDLIAMVPKWSKWQPALLPLYLFCFNSALASISTPLTNTLNALGKVKINTYLMLMWTALTWGIIPILATKFGYVGVSFGVAIIALSSIIPVIIVKKIINFNLTNSFMVPTVATLIMLLTCWYLPNIWLKIIIGITVYLLIVVLLAGKQVLSDARKIFNFNR